ncbi:tetratricopeptide repeat protein [Rufibacter psychrotolerans]|uniref:tetratricopeptide repeat protein n=1 Tax=Rufibacter psychrotolerans TaxID=2812556 RepID=UPI001967CEDA|nr:tetratricopeptide repeat protein [Rufibacter sp. SYSU D00308]
MKAFFPLARVLGASLLVLLSTTGWARQDAPTAIPITTTSEEARQLYLKAREDLNNLKFQNVAALLDQALQADPDFAMAHLLRTLAAGKSGDQQAFQQHLAKATALKDRVSDGEQCLISFVQANINHKPQEAVAAIDQAVRLYPKDKYALLWRGQNAQGRGEVDRAIESLTAALALDPHLAPAYNALGYAYTNKEDYDKARKAFEAYIRLAPQEANPYDSMGDLLQKLGKHKEAIQHFRKAAELDPSFNISLTKVGHTYLLMGQYDEARKAYQYAERQASLYLEKADNLLAMADAYLSEGRYQEAMGMADKALTVLQENNNTLFQAWVYLQNAEVYTQMNALAQARQNLDQASALKNRGDFIPVQSARLQERILYVEALLAAKRHDFALARTKAEALRTQLAANGHSTGMKEYHQLAGILAYEQGDMKEALAQLAQADQVNPRVVYLQSLAEARTGNKGKANQFKRKLLALHEPGLEYALVMASMAKKPKMAAK